MTTYFTKEPLGSTSPYVLFDNAQNFDYALNDITQAIWKDRFGRNRKTYWGWEQESAAQLLNQQQRFNTFVQSSGYKVIGDYTAGPLTISEYNQLIRYNNELWKLTAATNLPFTTIGNDAASWVNDSAHFVSVGDAALRQELSSPGGAGLVGGLAKPVTSEAFSGGADPSGVDVSTPAFMSMFSAGGSHYIPDGDYNFGGVEFNPDYAPTVMVAGPNVRFPNGRINLGGAGKLMPNENQPIWSQHLIRRKYTSEDGWMGYGNIYQFASVAESNIPTSKNGKGGSQVVAVYGRGFANAIDSAAFGANFAAYANHATAYPVGVEINVGNYVAGGTGVGCQVISNGMSNMRAAHYIGSAVATSRYLSGIELSVGDNDGFVNQAILIGNQTTPNYYQTPCGIRARNTSFTESELDLPSLYVGLTRYDVAVGGNKVEIRGAAKGGSARVLAIGSDANINLTLHGKGTGNVMVASSFRPETANTFSCGTSTAPWAGGFTQTAFTVTSDETHKTKPIDISDAILDAAEEVQLMQYQYLDRVEAKGLDGARWHFGAIAQRYVEAFERHGLDAHRFGFLCYDEWDDQYAQVQTNEGEVVVKTRMVEKPVVVTKTRTVSRPVMTTMVRDVLVDEVLEDGTRIKKVIQEECQAPQQSQVYIFNEDGSPHLNDKGEHLFVNEPVMQDVIEEYSEWINEEHAEEYTEPAAPEYENILAVPAGSRYGIRYEEMLVLEAAVQRRKHDRLLQRIVALQGKE